MRVVNSRLDVYLGSDSYWSHASSIDQMSTMIRETLIALHPSDVYGKLLNEARG
jgi:DNA-directed RNA polymerase